MSSFADIDAVITRAMGAWRPPPRLSLSAWADRYYVLSAETAAEPGRWRTLPYQREIMDAITDPAVTQVSVMKSARVGYAMALDTPLPTPTGWTTMGAVDVGGELFDEVGRRCRVISKSEVFTDHDCYRVEFCDGSTAVADAGHRWFVESDVALELLLEGRGGRTGRPKPGETRTFSGVINTAQMERALRTPRGRTALAIGVADPLKLRRRSLPIPPYTLGLWLGDGHSAAARITQHRPDVDETASYIAAEGVRNEVLYLDRRYPNNATIVLGQLVRDASKRRYGSGSEWRRRLRAAGVLNNKYVPTVYLRASNEQRLELLRGLMDSDGTIGNDGRAEFVNTNERLARAVYELVVSLGMKASIRHRPPQRARCLEQWRVNFKPTPDLNPFRIRRKAAKVLVALRPTITKRRRIVAVTPVAPVPVQCIQVDSPSRLFLAGPQMVPTHNTLMMSAAIGYYMAQDPTSILVVQPTVDDAKNFSKETIAPMLRDVPVLARLVFRDLEEKGKGPKDASATLQHKAFAGGILSMIGANSGAGFRRVSRRVVMFDEVDAYPPSAGSEGDQIQLGMKRSEAFHNRKIIAGSTPLIAGASRIEELFLAGDQRRYYVPCPHCQSMDFFTFDQAGDRGHVMRWPEGEPGAAYFQCRACGCSIEHKDKRWMVERGEWRPDNPSSPTRSYHLWAAVSYSPNATWGQIAAEFLEAKRGGPEKLKTFVNTTLGETWKERGDAPEWERLFQRREPYKIGTVPNGAIVLTAGVDVQKDRFVYEVVGWAANRESWSIDAGALYGDTSLEASWSKLDELLARAFIAEDGATHTIAMLAVDSGYNTQVVYNWGRRYPMSRVIATKGVAGSRMLVGSPSPVELMANGKKLRRGYKVWPIGVDVGKGELYGQLRLKIGEDGTFPPGFCHFPEHSEDYFKQLTAEHLVTSVNKATRRSRLEWHVLPNRENHMLDCRVMARVAAAVLGIDRIRPGTTRRLNAPAASRATAKDQPSTTTASARAELAPSSPPSPTEPPTSADPQAPPRAGFWKKAPGAPRAGSWFKPRR